MICEAIEDYREQGERSFHRGEFEEATVAFERALESEDAEAQPGAGLAALWSAKGACLARLGRYEEAAVCLERAARLEPDDATHRSRLGEVHIQRRQFQRAIEAFDLALAIDDGCPSALFGMARVLAIVGRMREAREVARRLSAVAGRPALIAAADGTHGG